MLKDSDLKNLQPREKKYQVSAGQSLYVDVYTSGRLYFVWRYRFPPGTSPKPLQLGPYGRDGLSLAKARRLVEEWKVKLRQGIDPRLAKAESRKSVSAGVKTFGEVAGEWMERLRERKRAENTLLDYGRKLNNQILPVLGNLSIKDIERRDCLALKQDIERRGSLDQSDRVMSLMRQIFQFAIDREYRSGENPARASEFSKSAHKTKHYPYLRFEEMPAFFSALEANEVNGDRVTVLAVKALLLTGMRVGGLMPTQWSEVDADNRVITIPKERMKNAGYIENDHLIPIADPLMAVLDELHAINGRTDWVFFSARGKATPHINLEAPNKHIGNLGYKGKLVAHGVRAMVLTYGQEKLGFEFDVIDRQLGHKPQGKVRQAYDRTEWIDQRVKFMTAWGDLLMEQGLVI